MGTKEDLTGQRFGRIVIDIFSHMKNGQSYWIGHCDCGKITKPCCGADLKRKKIKSCGCLFLEVNSEKGKKVGILNSKDITGNTYGYLTALRPTQERRRTNVVWECRCKCGNIVKVSCTYLVQGKTTSCGCRTISKLHERTRQALINLVVEIHQEEFPIHQADFTFTNTNIILRADFVVIVNNSLIAIECQGEQHYKALPMWGGEEGYNKRQELDALKKKCLKVMNFPLIEVKYNEPNIEKYLMEELLGGKR